MPVMGAKHVKPRILPQRGSALSEERVSRACIRENRPRKGPWGNTV